MIGELHVEGSERESVDEDGESMIGVGRGWARRRRSLEEIVERMEVGWLGVWRFWREGSAEGCGFDMQRVGGTGRCWLSNFGGRNERWIMDEESRGGTLTRHASMLSRVQEEDESTARPVGGTSRMSW